MRIGIDIRALMEGKTTGVEVYLVNLLHALFQLDQKNDYILFANSWQKISLPKFDYPNTRLVITRYPNKFFNLAQKFLQYPKIDRLLGGLDIFFSPHWRVSALSPSIPLVVIFHDLVSEFAPQFFTLRRRLWHAFMDYRGAARRAKKIIAVSENTKRDLVELYGMAENKIEVIYPGISPSPQSFPVQGEEERPFLYFGTFEPRKNIEAVLAAYADYRKTSKIKRPLVIAGSSGWKTRVAVPQSLKNQVTVKQNVPEEEKANLYEQAFVLVFPSFYEGFGFPLLEAARAGLPVIASFDSSLVEIGKDFVLYANPFRPAQIADAMLELENDAKLYEDLGNRGYRAAQNFKWQDTAEKTLRLFEEVAL